jgi:hypothetical protein
LDQQGHDPAVHYHDDSVPEVVTGLKLTKNMGGISLGMWLVPRLTQN